MRPVPWFDWRRSSDPPPRHRDSELSLHRSRLRSLHQRVQRALRSYAANGSLRRIGGLLFGRPLEKPDDQDAAILRVVAEEEGLEIPVITRMDFGHTDPMFVLPYGVRARIDCEGRMFAIIESAVA